MTARDFEQVDLFEGVIETHATQRERLMRLLRAQEWVTNVDCIRAGIPNFRSRFSEMRRALERDGLTISSGERVTASVYKYRLRAAAPRCQPSTAPPSGRGGAADIHNWTFTGGGATNERSSQ